MDRIAILDRFPIGHTLLYAEHERGGEVFQTYGIYAGYSGSIMRIQTLDRQDMTMREPVSVTRSNVKVVSMLNLTKWLTTPENERGKIEDEIFDTLWETPGVEFKKPQAPAEPAITDVDPSSAKYPDNECGEKYVVEKQVTIGDYTFDLVHGDSKPGNRRWWICKEWMQGMGLLVFDQIAADEKALDAIVEGIGNIELPNAGRGVLIPCHKECVYLRFHGKRAFGRIFGCRYVVRFG